MILYAKIKLVYQDMIWSHIIGHCIMLHVHRTILYRYDIALYDMKMFNMI